MAWLSKGMVEKTGVNVAQLVELLVKNAAAELTMRHGEVSPFVSKFLK